MRGLFIAITALWCSFAGFGTQAQSLDTLQFAAQYQNGVSVTHDTVFAQRKKIAVPTSVNVLPSNVPYTATLRFIGENDTLVATYTSNGNSPLRIMNISADTVYASHLDFSFVFNDVQTLNGQAVATIVLQTEELTTNSCYPNGTCHSSICNRDFGTTNGTNVCQNRDADNFGEVQLSKNWTSSGYAHYFKANCASAYKPNNISGDTDSNPFGSQIGYNETSTENAYVGISAYYYTEESNVSNGFIQQTRQTQLLPNYRYVGSFRASLADKSKYKVGGLGMYVSNSTSSVGFSNDTAVNDVSGWKRVSGLITAGGLTGLTNISVGNFGSETATTTNIAGATYRGAYYFIDDVRLSIVPKDIPETLVICGNVATIGEIDTNFNCGDVHTTTKWEKFIGTKPSGFQVWHTVPNQTEQTATVSFPEDVAIYRRIVTIDGIAVISICTVSKQAPATVEIDTNIRTVVCTDVPFRVTVTNPDLTSYTWSATQWLDNPTGNPRYDSVANSNTFYTLTGGNSAVATFTFNAGGMYIIKVLVGNGDCSVLVRSDTIDVIKNCCVRAGTVAADTAVNNPRVLIVLGNPRKGVVYTALPTAIAPEKSMHYYVAGNIAFKSNTSPSVPIVAATARFYVRGATQLHNRRTDHEEVIAAPYISLYNNGILRLRKETIIRAACDTMWGGIRVYSNASQTDATLLDMANTNNLHKPFPNRIEDSYNGVMIYAYNQNNGAIIKDMGLESRYNIFLNNMHGVRFMTHAQLSSSNNPLSGRTIQYTVFSCSPTQMAAPFDSIGSNDYYYSYAHISNVAGKKVNYPNAQQDGFSRNMLENALYGIKLTQHSTTFPVALSTFRSCRIAGLWHTNGTLLVSGHGDFVFGKNITDAPLAYQPYNRRPGVVIPLTESNSFQIKWERALKGISHTYKEGYVVASDEFLPPISSFAPTYGIYADSNSADTLGNKLTLTSFASLPNAYNHIGYYNRNGDVSVVINTDSAAVYENGSTAIFHKLRTAVFLDGVQGKYFLSQTRYQNNETSIRINRSVASNISLKMYCNDFMSLPDTGTNIYPARTGIHITGVAGTTLNFTNNSSRLGGCETGTLTGSPVGSEVRNTVNDKDESETNPTPPLPANSTFNFRYINYQLGGLLQYYGYANENVSTVSNTNVQFRTCAGINEDYVLANKNTCLRTQVGVNYRKAAPVQQVSLLQNAPNPTRGITHISYTLPEDAVGKAQMVVYAPVSGKPMFSQTLQEVEGSIELNIKDWATGVYPYLLLIDGQVVQRNKLAVIK